jgi:predicted RNA-binding Zn-ribbon protein involved in translation (DUF1610 family)
MAQNPVLCPDCGWTGTRSELDEGDEVHNCPVCDTDIEFV